MSHPTPPRRGRHRERHGERHRDRHRIWTVRLAPRYSRSRRPRHFRRWTTLAVIWAVLAVVLLLI